MSATSGTSTHMGARVPIGVNEIFLCLCEIKIEMKYFHKRTQRYKNVVLKTSILCLSLGQIR